MGRSGIEVGVTEASEGTQRSVVRGYAIEHKVRCVVLDGAGGPYVEQMGGGMEGFDQKARRHVSLEEGAEDVVCRADGTLRLAILVTGVRTGEA